MFGLDISSKYIKYIGLFIVMLILVLVFISVYNIINDKVHDFFGIKTKEEKMASIKLDKAILKANNKELIKDVIINNKIKDIETNTTVSYTNKTALDEKIINDIEIESHNIKKPNLIHNKHISKKYLLHTEKIVKDKTLVTKNKSENVNFTVNKQEYIKYGSDNIDIMFKMYSFIKEKK